MKVEKKPEFIKDYRIKWCLKDKIDKFVFRQERE